MITIEKMIQEDKINCVGCYGCYNICPKKAIVRVCQEFCVNRFNKQHRIAA